MFPGLFLVFFLRSRGVFPFSFFKFLAPLDINNLAISGPASYGNGTATGTANICNTVFPPWSLTFGLAL